MARPFSNRVLNNPPFMLGFNPFGTPVKPCECIKLQFDEYESFILINYQHCSQEKAATRMNVSRPTFTRIYNKSLQKIAKAFGESLPLIIEGGNVQFEKPWFKCKKCFKLIEGKENHKKCKNCKSFGDEELESVEKQTILTYNK